MRPGTVGASVAAWLGAVLSSLCCLLPLAVIVLGLGSGAFMTVTMQYRGILIPAGVLGAVLGFVFHLRERRRCVQLACRMAGGRVTLSLLIAASVVVATAIVLDQFPEMASDLIARLSEGPGSGSPAGHDMTRMPQEERR
jgi:TRAP-type C4-dicarboxylate transport system permease large subunit